MSASPALELVLRRTAFRRRALRAWDYAWKGGLAGAAIALVVVALWKFQLVDTKVLLWFWLAAALSPLVAAVIGGWRQSERLATARWLDERQRLQQRLSTALDLTQKSGTPSPSIEAWRQLVVRDAESAASQVNLNSLLPFRFPRIAHWSLAAWLAILGLSFLPAYQTAAQRQGKKDAPFIKEAGKELVGLVKRQIEQRPPVMEAPKRALSEVEELGAKLSSNKLTREDALKDLAKVTEDINREAATLQRSPVLKKMAEAARSGEKGANPDGAAQQKKMEELSQKLGEMANHPDAAESLKKDLEKLQAQAKGLAGDPSPSAAEQREKLADQARQLAQKAAEMGAPLPSLEAAAQALSAAQVENFLKDLKVAEMDLNKMAAMAQALAEMK